MDDTRKKEGDEVPNDDDALLHHHCTAPSMKGSVQQQPSPSKKWDFHSPHGKAMTRYDSNKMYSTAITPDQRHRMRAYALQRQAVPAASSGTHRDPMTAPQPVDKPWKLPIPRTPIRANPYRKTSPTKKEPVTPEPNRKHGLEIQEAAVASISETTKKNKMMTTKTTSSPSPPACARCGSTTPNSLCLVWYHTGAIQRRYDGLQRQDYFTMECCGRRLPQPCFIGKHSFPDTEKNELSSFQYSSPSWRMHDTSSDSSLVVQCHCNELASLRRTRKDGSNTGRYFFRCGTYADCNFFRWVDQVYGLDKDKCIPKISPDGVKEWLHPHTNPFSELHLLQQGVITKAQSRKRLLAALVIREMISKVTDGPFVLTCMPSDSLLDDVWKKLTTTTTKTTGDNDDEEAIVKELFFPLQLSQIERRLGPLSSLQEPVPDKNELEDVLQQVLKDSQVIRSTVQYSVITARGGAGPGSDDKQVGWLDMTGLENYCEV